MQILIQIDEDDEDADDVMNYKKKIIYKRNVIIISTDYIKIKRRTCLCEF